MALSEPIATNCNTTSQPSDGVVVFTRASCCLCTQAIELLKARGLEPTLIDVDARLDLAGELGKCVPVVAIDGKIRFRGRVHPVLLDRLLAHRHASA